MAAVLDRRFISQAERQLRPPWPRRVDHHRRADRTLRRFHPRDPPPLDADRRHLDALPNRRAERLGGVGIGCGCHRTIGHAGAGFVRAAADVVHVQIGGQGAHALRVEKLRADPDLLLKRDVSLQPVQIVRADDEQCAGLDPTHIAADGVLKIVPDLPGTQRHARGDLVGIMLPDQSDRPPGAAGGQVFFLQQDGAITPPRELVGRTHPGNPAADDDHICRLLCHTGVSFVV